MWHVIDPSAGYVITGQCVTEPTVEQIAARGGSDAFAVESTIENPGYELEVVNGTVRVVANYVSEVLADFQTSEIIYLKDDIGKQAVFTNAPEYKQINALLGLSTEEEKVAIINWIVRCRTIINNYEAAIINAATLADCKIVVGNLTQATIIAKATAPT